MRYDGVVSQRRSVRNLQRELLEGGYGPETPVAIVYKASWPDEKIICCRLCDLKETVEKNNVKKTALILVADSWAMSTHGPSSMILPSRPSSGGGEMNRIAILYFTDKARSWEKRWLKAGRQSTEAAQGRAGIAG